MAGAFPFALAAGGWTSLGVFAVAATSDYLDGPLARRSGRSTPYGALLDGVADIVFVLTGTIAAAVGGRLSWLVPLAIAGSATAYLVASVRQSRTSGRPARAYSLAGHAAGVCNYALVGLVAGSVALPSVVWPALLAAGGAIVVALNVGALLLRALPARGAGASPA